MYSKYVLEIHSNLSLWQDVDSETLIVRKAAVMPVRPQIEVVPSLSRKTRSGRKIIYQVENMDVIAAMTNF